MPYKVIKNGNKYCVHKMKNGKIMGDSIGCHTTRKSANKQMAALHANEKGK